MEKWLCWGALGVAGLMLLLFVLDLIPGVNFPFGGIDWYIDVIGIIACGLTGYLAWESFREMR